MAKFNLPLKKILGTSYMDYIANLIVPKLEELESNGEIKKHELRKIRDLVYIEGIDSLLPEVKFIDDVTLNTIESDGYIAEAVLKLTDNAVIKNIIKRSSGKEDFKRAVESQKKVYNALKNTKYEGKVPDVTFTNKKKRIQVTPFAEGDILKNVLDGKSNKENILKKVIDDYVDMFSYLNKPEIRKKLDFPNAMKDFNEFFANTYSGNEKLIKLFKKDIGDDLNKACKEVIHADTHGKNILINGKTTYLDWAKAASNGFFEFDIGKLLSKTGINNNLERKLVEYAASKKYKTSKERKESVKRYEKNKILHELWSASNYLNKSNESEDAQDRLFNYAQVSYNDAVRRIRRAVDEGIVSKDFLEEILKNPKKDLSELADSEYERLKQDYDPESSMTLNILQKGTPLTGLIDDSPEKSIDDINGKIKAAKYGRIAKIAGLILLGGLLVGGVGYTINNLNKWKQQRIERKQQEEDWRESIKERYRDTFEYAFRRVAYETLDGNITNRLPINSKRIDDVAEKYGLNPFILKQMMKVNRYYAKVDWSNNVRFRHIEDINILDPFAVKSPGFEGTNDPITNLEKGAKRLAKLKRKNKGDIDKALLDFYTPFEIEGDDVYRWDYGSIGSQKDLSVVEEEIRRIAYNATTTLNQSMDGGLFLLDFNKVPKDFPKVNLD